MAENTKSAGCTEAEWAAARAAGLLFADLGSTAQELALHKFADAVREELMPVLLAAASDIDCLMDFIGESDAIEMVGARNACAEARKTLHALTKITAEARSRA